ncbi:hypothetical protein VaNZ11_001774 [Volvox africanus]|uniref:Uncharacterized protein n=1 Tax=Volvox africanus TaxID=51714 RepID=A0ABQ5RQF8_9CHLO|nr:hypothetical protein VaNZ11_001774 [Volvox africanus]
MTTTTAKVGLKPRSSPPAFQTQNIAAADFLRHDHGAPPGPGSPLSPTPVLPPSSAHTAGPHFQPNSSGAASTSAPSPAGTPAFVTSVVESSMHRPQHQQHSHAVAYPPAPALPRRSSRISFWGRACYFFLGAGMLAAWNALITATDYFGAVYPGWHTDRLFTVSYLPVCLLMLMVGIRYPDLPPQPSRIRLGYAGFTLAMAAVPLVDAFFVAPAGTRGGAGGATAGLAAAPVGGLVAVVVCVAIVGACDGLCQGALFAEAAQLPPPFTQAVVTGTASSGLLVCLLRIVSKASFESGADSEAERARGLRGGTRLYFALAGLMSLSCLILYDTLLPRLRTLSARETARVTERPTLPVIQRKAAAGAVVSTGVAPSGFGDADCGDHNEDPEHLYEHHPLLLPLPLELSTECRSHAGSAEGSCRGNSSRHVDEHVVTAHATGGAYSGTAERSCPGTQCVAGVGDAAAALPVPLFIAAVGSADSVRIRDDADDGSDGGGGRGGGDRDVFRCRPLVQATEAPVAAADAGRGSGCRPPIGEDAPLPTAEEDIERALVVRGNGSGRNDGTRIAAAAGTHGTRCGGGVGLQIWHCLALSWPLCGSLFVTYTVTLSIFPGFLSEDVHSVQLGDWYPILLITSFNLADLVGKSLPVMSHLSPHPPRDEGMEPSLPPVRKSQRSERHARSGEAALPHLDRQQHQGGPYTDHPNRKQEYDQDPQLHQLDHPRLQQMPLLSSQPVRHGAVGGGRGMNSSSSSSSGASVDVNKGGWRHGRSFSIGVLRAGVFSRLVAVALRPLRQPGGLLLVALLRGLVALPAFLVAARFHTPAWVMGTLTTALGISNGYLTTQVLTMGPAAVLSTRASSSSSPPSVSSSSPSGMTTTPSAKPATVPPPAAAASAACQFAATSRYLSGDCQDVSFCPEGPTKVQRRLPTSSCCETAGSSSGAFTIAAATGYQPLPAAESVEGLWSRDTGDCTTAAAKTNCTPSVGGGSSKYSGIAIGLDPNQDQIHRLGQGPVWVRPGAPEPPSHHHDTEVVETLLVISLVAGLNVGAYLGWLWLL